jgi:hypothetical protein
MNGHFFKDGVEFFQLQTVGCVLTILLRNVTRCTRHARILVLGALHDNLNSIAFLCHFRKNWDAKVAFSFYCAIVFLFIVVKFFQFTFFGHNLFNFIGIPWNTLT